MAKKSTMNKARAARIKNLTHWCIFRGLESPAIDALESDLFVVVGWVPRT
jgi:hypothetical protein